MRSVAVIACSNGLGHVRRTLLLVEALRRAGMVPTLLAPAASVARIGQTLQRSFDGIVVRHFDTGTCAAALRVGDFYATRWVERLPSLDGFDLVVSDNLPEVLERRPDAVLSGSFLWHLDLADVSPSYFDNAQALLRRNRPPMLASRLFATPGLAKHVVVLPVGLYAAFARPTAQGEDLLISCGHGGDAVEALYALVIAGILKHGKGGFRRVWVEPRLMPAVAPDWMAPAQFDAGLYGNLKAAICRPGMGTISDALVAGARIYSLYEPGNRELEFNTIRLDQLGVGFAATNATDALDAALAFASSTDSQARHWSASQTIDSDGAYQAAAILASRIERGSK